MKTPSLEQFKAWAKENRGLAMDVVKAQAYAQTMRAAVDKIQRHVLTEVALYDDMNAEHNHTERKRITDPKLTYLSQDDAAWKRYDAECNTRERAAGLKPADMPDDYCPALVAENDQIKAERAILDSGGSLFGFEANQLSSHDFWQRGLKLMLGAALKEGGEGSRAEGIMAKRQSELATSPEPRANEGVRVAKRHKHRPVSQGVSRVGR